MENHILISDSNVISPCWGRSCCASSGKSGSQPSRHRDRARLLGRGWSRVRVRLMLRNRAVPPPRSCPVSAGWQSSPRPTPAWSRPGQCVLSYGRSLEPPLEGWCSAPRCKTGCPRSRWQGSCRPPGWGALGLDPRDRRFSGHPRHSGGRQFPAFC
jgi:hypothetical protein